MKRNGIIVQELTATGDLTNRFQLSINGNVVFGGILFKYQKYTLRKFEQLVFRANYYTVRNIHISYIVLPSNVYICPTNRTSYAVI